MRNFRQYTIWKDRITIVNRIYKLALLLLNEEKFGLKSQICRASVSTLLNITKGSSISSDIVFKIFLEMALGSTYEFETK